ncbi:MAG TPA: DUF4167 domain-containing protein, partial [Paracoccaceae bacterium]|nr:DUF4167 domain-containing protein [Paracoccaceae bacterium]
MRPSNKQRSRNKSGNSPQRRGMGNIVNRVFESAGPDGKVRGTPQQIIDKYLVLARDAQVSGDRVAAESFLQHAEHYTRLLGEAQRQTQESRQAQESRQDDRGDGRDVREEREAAAPREEAEAERTQEPVAEAGDQQQGTQQPQQPSRPRRTSQQRQTTAQQQQAAQPQGITQPERAETSGLATFDSEEPADQGPVETP